MQYTLHTYQLLIKCTMMEYTIAIAFKQYSNTSVLLIEHPGHLSAINGHINIRYWHNDDSSQLQNDPYTASNFLEDAASGYAKYWLVTGEMRVDRSRECDSRYKRGMLPSILSSNQPSTPPSYSASNRGPFRSHDPRSLNTILSPPALLCPHPGLRIMRPYLPPSP